jgi:hypothetical protein
LSFFVWLVYFVVNYFVPELLQNNIEIEPFLTLKMSPPPEVIE